MKAQTLDPRQTDLFEILASQGISYEGPDAECLVRGENETLDYGVDGAPMVVKTSAGRQSRADKTSRNISEHCADDSRRYYKTKRVRRRRRANQTSEGLARLRKFQPLGRLTFFRLEYYYEPCRNEPRTIQHNQPFLS